MKLKFIGATHEVTGSCTLLELCGKYYLVDCGMEQGIDVYQNVDLPVKPEQLEAVFLTHAHIDHSGMIPKLYKDGFRGYIYATDVTCDLCRIMLMDSAHIQESEVTWKNRKATRSGKPTIEATYTTADAEGAIKLFRPCHYGEIIGMGEGIQVRFTDVGHLLGSACIELWLTENDIQKKLVFSGDIGNTNRPIIKDPQHVKDTDYLVIESTYGNRIHDEYTGDVVSELAQYIQQALDSGGNVVIPSFAVGRTQEILYAIRIIKEKGMVKGHDGFPVYVDSPLAAEATGIFMQCDPVCFDDETLEAVKRGDNPIWFDGLRITTTTAESIQINFSRTPCVIISSSGMCEAGRIRHHLKHNLWRKGSTILFVGYQAQNSLGRRLLDGVKTVKLFGEEIAVNARICSLHGTSGHADRNGLLNWLYGFEKKPEFVFVNHGEAQSCEDFKTLLISKGYRAIAPYSGTEFDLIAGKMTEYAEGIAVVKKSQAAERSSQVYNELVKAAEELLSLAKTFEGHSNKDIGAFTSQIKKLTSKHK